MANFCSLNYILPLTTICYSLDVKFPSKVNIFKTLCKAGNFQEVLEILRHGISTRLSDNWSVRGEGQQEGAALFSSCLLLPRQRKTRAVMLCTVKTQKTQGQPTLEQSLQKKIEPKLYFSLYKLIISGISYNGEILANRLLQPETVFLNKIFLGYLPV